MNPNQHTAILLGLLILLYVGALAFANTITVIDAVLIFLQLAVASFIFKSPYKAP